MRCVPMSWAKVLERKEISPTEMDLIFESSGFYVKITNFILCQIIEITDLINMT